MNEIDINELKRNIRALMDYLGWSGEPSISGFPPEIVGYERQHMFTRYHLPDDEVWCFGCNKDSEGQVVDEITLKKIVGLDKVGLLRAIYRSHLDECVKKAHGIVLTRMVEEEFADAISFNPLAYAEYLGL